MCAVSAPCSAFRARVLGLEDDVGAQSRRANINSRMQPIDGTHSLHKTRTWKKSVWTCSRGRARTRALRGQFASVLGLASSGRAARATGHL